MEFHRPTAEIFVPDGLPYREALARTTHMGIGAHPDDVEILGIHGILECFRAPERGFCGVVLTDGSGAPRAGSYRGCSDEAIRAIRRREQKKAAVVGEYVAQVLLGYPSSVVRDGADERPVEDLVRVLAAARPQVVYTHSPADRHETHVAVALRVIEAARRLPASTRPRRLYGCEVWGELDWLAEEDRVVFDCSARENLQGALLGVFDSQISGGKRYDLATMGRRRAHATYSAFHEVDVATGLLFAMDLSPLVENPSLDVRSYVRGFIDRFAREVEERIEAVSAPL